MWFTNRLACSFCGTRNEDVAKLVAGPRVYICDRCVAIAARLMEEGGPPPPTAERRTAKRSTGLLSRLVARISHALGARRLRRSQIGRVWLDRPAA